MTEAAPAKKKHRRHGEGSIHQRSDGVYVIALQQRGRRLYRYARTLEAAEARLELLKTNMIRGRTDRLMANTRRDRALGWVRALIEQRGQHAWSDDDFARIIVAQLSPSRIKRDVFGPCTYCGSWIASTVDHAVPTSKGGPDTPDNLVSACLSCNSRKRDRGHELFRSLVGLSE